jgi:hypothetical protein
MSSRFARLRCLVPLAIVVLAGGCNGFAVDVLTIARYEPADDSFHCLQVFSNIASRDKKRATADGDHLASIWESRRSLVNCPFPIFSLPLMIERQGKDRFRDFRFNDGPKREEFKKTTVDLDSIEAEPGLFCLTPDRTLAYWHRTKLPGKTADAILAEMTPHVAKGFADWGRSQQDLARKVGAVPTTWKQMRDEIVRSNFEPERESNFPREDVIYPLSAESLSRLAKGIDGSMKLTRNKDSVLLVVPLSNEDAGEIVSILDAFRREIIERVKAGKTVPNGDEWRRLLASLALRPLDGVGLELTMNMPQVAMFQSPAELKHCDEKQRAQYDEAIGWLEARKVPIDRAFSLEKLITENRP